ncbi:serine/threonine protein kinase, bacterial [Monoraphidium neglectum]|uniref:Serine/threonine protein kinase, bacterial n=1 Tax=Monoraphidium neglectum TaxID=145388 RepID=A0A0D2JXU8_9CHLO|nr:serine/threonine protein kinase, bacterial [Monoraphidium neglectum]KIZ03458.1 serine/threonine protein kinase, bacterial [Monoraphidium neglectum]|eukprot:XP_013902477.1 serine/threonine protein kinase, bacterial [Monoraphidium neglectum]
MSVGTSSDELEGDDELLSSSCCTTSNATNNAADATDGAAAHQPVAIHTSCAVRTLGRAAGGAAMIAVAGCAAAVVCAKLLRRRRAACAAPAAAPPPPACASSTACDDSLLLCQRLTARGTTSRSRASSGCSSSDTLTTDTSPDITATSIETSSDDISITALLDLSTSIASEAAAGLKTPDSCSTDTGRSTAADAASGREAPAAPCNIDTAHLPRGEWAPRGSELYAELESQLWCDADEVFAAGTPLGAGGQGEVRRVALLGRSYALKCDTKGDSEEGAFERQLSGAAARAHVVSPIVSACGDDCVTTYHLFELAAGDLDHVMTGHRYCTGWARLSPDQLAPVLRQLAEALGAMHSVGLAHNDVKPANFLLGYDGRLKIGDLGLTNKASTPPCGLSKLYAAPECAYLGAILNRSWPPVG